MRTVRFRMTGPAVAIERVRSMLESIDEVDRIEEVADQVEHLRDDSSSLGLVDDVGADFHDIEVHAQSEADSQQNIIPALVDTNMWNTLHLSQGGIFYLQLPDVATDNAIKLKVIAEVQHIPTPNNSSLPGVLVDYTAFAKVFTGDGKVVSYTTVALNYVWLRTRDDARSLASVRGALTTGKNHLTPLYDRRATEAALSADPIYLTLIGELELGAITALFLALLGCIVASWLSARSRLTNFAALRALGAAH